MEILGIKEPHPQKPASALVWELSFAPYLQFLEKQLQKCQNQIYRTYLQRIIGLIKSDERLIKPITDWGILAGHQELIELLQLNHVYPFEEDQNLLFAIGTPSPMRFFSYSKAFAELVLEEQTQALKLQPANEAEQGEKALQNLYRQVLHHCYEIPHETFGAEPVEYMTLEDHCQVCARYYRLVSNHQFITIRWEGDKPEMREEWLEYARGNIKSMNLIAVPLPLSNIVIEGFLIFKLKDETEEESLLRLNNIIVNLHALPEQDILAQVMAATSSLLGTDKARLGFMPLVKVNKEYVYHDTFSTTSIVFSQLREHHTPEELEHIFRILFSFCANHQLLHNNISYDIITGNEDDEVARYLHKYGLRSMAFFPVYHQSELIGVIELGSTEPDFVDMTMRHRVERALPMYREFLLYLQDKFRQVMNSFILERYTAIHPTMLWKFRDAAWQALRQVTQGNKDLAPTPAVRFDDLTPFYAAVDVKNSSVLRLQATANDLKRQLQHLQALLPQHMQANRAATEALLAQLDQAVNLEVEAQVSEHLQHTIAQLLSNNIQPEAATNLKTQLEDATSMLYASSNEFDQSIGQVNKTLKRVLVEEERSLRGLMPYYIDRFQTDGLEYNLYVGSAISPEIKYEESQGIRQIIQWQLQSILNMAKAVYNLQPYLPYPLQTTQLILVHLHKINLSFRRDERIFDVDGAYSIRYEVMKKRIDKVHLLHSEERLTQPGTICIVYANEQEIKMYTAAYERLIEEGKLQPAPEFLELEPLQGISGLKAVRLRITL